ncbi:MAG: hypothetical protein IKS10_06175 [Lachnospiraceae bacterium]|nr:hypothetical protein [Lachnospiraceae bacterium]
MKKRILQRKHKVGALLLCLALSCAACEMEPEQETTAGNVAQATTVAQTTTAVETATAVEKTTAVETTAVEPTTVAEPTTAEVTTAAPETTEAPTQEYISPYNEEYGSAGTLSGTTVVVSIVTNDQNTHWGFTNGGDANAENDRATLMKQKSYLLAGCEWLSDQATSYGKKADFITDWEAYPDLYYEYNTTEELVRFDGAKYHVQKDYILETIPSNELKKKYRADNIIYVFYFNTPAENDVNPWSLSMTADPICDRELINVYTKFKGFNTMPCTYAHEMMHCFGAYDLYYANKGIPQEYVDYLTETNSQDIMYRVYDSEKFYVNMSELDAYYIGLTDSCEDVVTWNLASAARFR